MHNAEVVDADVREHRAAGDFADGPNAGSGRGEALVRFDVSVCVELDARDVEADSLRVGVRPVATRRWEPSTIF